MEANVTDQDFIDQKEIAEILSVKPKSIYYLMETDTSFPKPLVLSPRIRRWKKQDVLDWINSKLE
jgi:predicted DNA-binding transcriptional regulator AlpA|tara:strand:+ start:157 stop:351 length:195 start_codon:yes stop_codon:yes gene_type:complete